MIRSSFLRIPNSYFLILFLYISQIPRTCRLQIIRQENRAYVQHAHYGDRRTKRLRQIKHRGSVSVRAWRAIDEEHAREADRRSHLERFAGTLPVESRLRQTYLRQSYQTPESRFRRRDA